MPEDGDVPETEDIEERIVLEKENSSRNRAVVAFPNKILAKIKHQKNNKREQKEITDFFAKKHISKK